MNSWRMSWGLAWLGGGLCAVLVAGVPALLRAQCVASAQSDAPPPEVVVPGELVIEPPTLIVCDASFIGLAKLLTRPLELAAPDAMLVALFKPQFEVGPANVGEGGIVSRPAAVAAAADELERWLAKVGWVVRQWTDSPITGADGNRERLFVARNY